VEKLSSRERLTRLYTHRQTDRPGLFVRWGGMEADDDPTYAELKSLVRETTDLKLPWDGSVVVEGPPVERRREPHDEQYDTIVTVLRTPMGDLERRDLAGRHGQPGYCVEHFLKTTDDCEKYLRLPLPRIAGSCSTFFEVERRIGERGIVDVALGLNPAGAVVELLGSERFAIMSIEERSLVHRLIGRECEVLCRLVRFLCREGVGPFFALAGQEYLTPPLHGRRDFFEFNVAYDRKVTDLIRAAGGRTHVHCHGSIGTVLDGFVELGADVIHPFEAPPMGDVAPGEAKRALRGRVTLEGNIQIADMYGASSDDIQRQVRALVRDVFDDREGLIVCPTASPYRAGEGALCTRNYRAMIEAVSCR
jgi:hypothetical protein